MRALAGLVLLIAANWSASAAQLPNPKAAQIGGYEGQNANDNTGKPEGTAHIIPFIIQVMPAPLSKEEREKEKEKERHKAEHEAAALDAEQWVARWTFVLALVTATLAWYTGRLFRATRSIIASAEEASKRQLRAYVGIDDIEITLGDKVVQAQGITTRGEIGWTWEDTISVRIKNFGQTPAERVYIHVNWQPMKAGHQLPEDFTYNDSGVRSAREIGPTLSFDMIDAGSFVTKIIAIQEISDIQNFNYAIDRSIYIYFYGHIDYRDIFGDLWVREFCYHWVPWASPGRSTRFPTYHEHNGEKRKQPSTIHTVVSDTEGGGTG